MSDSKKKHAVLKVTEALNLTLKRKNGLLELQPIELTVHLTEKPLKERLKEKPPKSVMNGKPCMIKFPLESVKWSTCLIIS